MFDSLGAPEDSNPLVGRGHELRALRDAFAAGALVVVLTGPAGIGKSTLAAAFASSHHCRVIDVDVDAIDAFAAIREAVARQEPTLVVVRHLDARPPTPPGSLRVIELAPLDPTSTWRLASRLGARDPARIAARAGGVPMLVERETELDGPRAATLRLLRLPELHDALAAAALVQTPTEPLLGAMLGRDVRTLFDALATYAPLHELRPLRDRSPP
jgi:hypothetical protein